MYKKELIYSPWRAAFYQENIRSGMFVPCVKNEKNVTSSNYWFDCRESFAVSFKNKTKNFLFAHTNNNGENILNFINNFERRLELKSFTQLVGCTNRLDISLVIPSRFWTRTSIRRQLFTILLRCGRNYKKRNFKHALYSHDYTKKTKSAVEKFLKGKTRYRGKLNGGWVSTFHPRHHWWGNVSSKKAQENLSKLY